MSPSHTGNFAAVNLAGVSLSVVIPVYNETARIVSTLERVLEFLRSRPEAGEVVIVDDGSTDDTVQVVEQVCRENPRVLPHLLTATAVRLVPDLDETPSRGTMASVDFRSTVVLERLPKTLPGMPPTQDSMLGLPGRGEVRARLLVDRNTEIVAAVQSERDIILVLNDLFYPSWRVYVDGQEQELLRANYLFRGVHVRPGAHQVVFRFEPFSWPAFQGTFVQLLRRDR